MRKDIMKTLDRISGFFFLALGIFICIEGYRVTLGNFSNMGPGFFPFLVGLVILGLSIALLIQSFMVKKVEQVIFCEDREKIPRVILCVLSLFAYGFFLEKIGFLLCTTVFIGFVAKAIAGQKWLETLILAILSSLVAYVLFRLLLKCELPTGFFGI